MDGKPTISGPIVLKYGDVGATRKDLPGPHDLLSLTGIAKGLYGDPDEYVRQLREGWE